MRLPAFLLLSVCLALIPVMASASDAVSDAQAALAGDNADDKHAAIRALGSKSAGSDATVIPLLISALNDRQAADQAARALSSRTGQTPPNGIYRSSQPPGELQAAWQKWYEAWKAKEELKALAKKLKDKDKPVAAAPGAAVGGFAAPAADAPATPSAPVEPVLDDLGKIARISLTDGGSLLCYIRSRRTDADGNLLSVQIVHRDGRGTETLSAGLISRIDENVEQ